MNLSEQMETKLFSMILFWKILAGGKEYCIKKKFKNLSKKLKKFFFGGTFSANSMILMKVETLLNFEK